MNIARYARHWRQHTARQGMKSLVRRMNETDDERERADIRADLIDRAETLRDADVERRGTMVVVMYGGGLETREYVVPARPGHPPVEYIDRDEVTR